MPMHLLHQSLRSATSCCCRHSHRWSSSSSRYSSVMKAHTSLKSHSSRIRSRPTTASAWPSEAIKRSGSRNILPLDLVESTRVKLALPIIGNAAYITIASGFLMTDMLTLRLALVGGYTGLVAFHSLHKRPLRIPLRWSALFVLVNAGAALLLIADKYPGTLPEEESRLYDEHFSMMTKGQFKSLIKLGTTRTLPAGYRLTQEGVHADTIYFTKRGHSRLYLRGKYAKDIEEGSFVNDVAFHRDDGDETEGAYGTVVTEGEVEVLEWNWHELREHLEGRPDMDRNVRLCLTSHLVEGLLQQRKAAYESSEVLGSFREDLPDSNVAN